MFDSKSITILIIVINLFGCRSNSEKLDNISPPKTENERITYSIDNKIEILEFSFPEIKTKELKRKWKNIKLTPVLKLGGLKNELFNAPTYIKLDKNENIYVLDIGDFCTKKFDSTGKFIRSFGKKGSGPGEFRMVFDFDLLDNGTVAMVAPNLNKFVVFEDEKTFEHKPNDMALKLCFVSENEVTNLQVLDFINISPIKKVDYLTQEIKEYENFLIPKNNNIDFFGYLVGGIHRFNRNKLVYVSSVFGYVVTYNKEGKIEKAFKLINSNKKHLEIKKTKFGIGFPRSKDYLIWHSNVNENMLYIFNNFDSEKNETSKIDVYSLENYNYKYSIELPLLGIIDYARLTNNKLLVIRENTEIEIYEYNKN
ncbi:MAG: 6-bladed beta-propeller [Rhodothermaceae bacterium]